MTTIFDGVKFCAQLIDLGIEEREALFLTEEQGTKVRDESLKSAPKCLAYVKKQGYIKRIRKIDDVYFIDTSRIGLVKAETETDQYFLFG